MSITVIQVFRFQGLDPTPQQSWAVGSRVAEMYLREFRKEPPKALRPKTHGGGSHCFAIYPDTWAKRIGTVIESVVEAERSQLDFFANA